MKNARLLIVLLLFCLAVKAQQEFEFTANCRSAQEAILHLKFSSAKTLLLKERKANPNNLIPFYLDNYIDFLSIIIFAEPFTTSANTIMITSKKTIINANRINNGFESTLEPVDSVAAAVCAITELFAKNSVPSTPRSFFMLEFFGLIPVIVLINLCYKVVLVSVDSRGIFSSVVI